MFQILHSCIIHIKSHNLVLFLRFRLKGAGVGRRVYEMPQVPEKVDRKIDRFKNQDS